NDLPLYGAQITFDPSVKRQIEREIAAQFEAYRATGLPLDHVDGHRHFQLHPVIARAVMAIGRRHGMKALRVPIQPWQTIAGNAGWAAWWRRGPAGCAGACAPQASSRPMRCSGWPGRVR